MSARTDLAHFPANCNVNGSDPHDCVMMMRGVALNVAKAQEGDVACAPMLATIGTRSNRLLKKSTEKSLVFVLFA